MIAIGAALLLIYYSKKPGQGSSSGMGRTRRLQATVMPEKRYKKSEDGKVVYLFDDARSEKERTDEPDESGGAEDGPDTGEKPPGPAPGNGVNGDGRE
jgi:hypothetical protein